MKSTSIPWQRFIQTGCRVAFSGTYYLLRTGGHLLHASGTTCTKLGKLVQRKASNPRASQGVHI